MEIFFFIKQFVSYYGYYALCLGLLIEGEMILVTAGILAQQQQLSMTWVIIYAFTLTLVRDQCMFTLGRLIGNNFFQRFPRMEKNKHLLLQKMLIFKRSIAFIYQFTFGFRYLAPFCFGMSTMKRRYFLYWNIINALIWTLLFSSLGYYLSSCLLPFIPLITKSGAYLAFLLVLLVIGTLFFKQFFKKNK